MSQPRLHNWQCPRRKRVWGRPQWRLERSWWPLIEAAMLAFDCQWLDCNHLHVGFLGLSVVAKTTAVVVLHCSLRPLESRAYLRSLKAGGPLGRSLQGQAKEVITYLRCRDWLKGGKYDKILKSTTKMKNIWGNFLLLQNTKKILTLVQLVKWESERKQKIFY